MRLPLTQLSLNEITSNPTEPDEVAANPTKVWMRLHLTLLKSDEVVSKPTNRMKTHLALLKSDEVASNPTNRMKTHLALMRLYLAPWSLMRLHLTLPKSE